MSELLLDLIYARDEIAKRKSKSDSPRSAVYLHHILERLRKLEFVRGGREALDEISNLRIYARDEILKRKTKSDSPRSAVYLHHILERLRNIEINMYGTNQPLIEFFKSRKEFCKITELLAFFPHSS